MRLEFTVRNACGVDRFYPASEGALVALALWHNPKYQKKCLNFEQLQLLRKLGHEIVIVNHPINFN